MTDHTPTLEEIQSLAATYRHEYKSLCAQFGELAYLMEAYSQKLDIARKNYDELRVKIDEVNRKYSDLDKMAKDLVVTPEESHE